MSGSVRHISIGKDDVDQKAVSAVLSHYSVGALKRAKRAPHGGVNDNWFVDTDEGRYFLRRRSTSYTRASIDFEHELIEYLVEAGFPTPCLIRTTGDARRVEIDGRNWELYDYVVGEPFRPGNLAQTRSAARLLARFHRLVADYHPTVSAPDRREDIGEVLRIPDQYRSKLKARTGPLGVLIAVPLLRFFRRQATLIWNGTRSLTAFSPTLIHGDFAPHNVLFRGDEASALLDFGDAAFFDRTYDIARAILDFSPSLDPDYRSGIDMARSMDLVHARAFARAYQAALPLSNTEIEAMEAMVRLAYLIDFTNSLGDFTRWRIDSLLNDWKLFRSLDRHKALTDTITAIMTEQLVASGRNGEGAPEMLTNSMAGGR